MTLAKRPTLASAVADLDLLANEIEDTDGEITDATLQRFANAQLAVKERVDGWINYLDAAKAMVKALKERKARTDKAFKSAKHLEQRLKQFLKYQVEAHPNLPFKGELGTLYLHKNPKGVKVIYDADERTPKDVIAIRDVTVRGCVDPRLLDCSPSMRGYLRTLSFETLDRKKIREDLEAGMELPWAKLSQGSGIRIKG